MTVQNLYHKRLQFDIFSRKNNNSEFCFRGSLNDAMLLNNFRTSKELFFRSLNKIESVRFHKFFICHLYQHKIPKLKSSSLTQKLEIGLRMWEIGCISLRREGNAISSLGCEGEVRFRQIPVPFSVKIRLLLKNRNS